MNEWLLAAALIAALIAPCLYVCARSDAVSALAALELGGTLTSTTLIAVCEGIHRQPFVDLALLFALLSMIGALIFARLMEQDL